MEIPLSLFVWGLALLGIGIVSDQLREAIKTFCEKISGLIEGLYEFAKNGLQKIIGWLKLTETPKPLPSFFGLLILAIAVLVSVAEFRISQKTITVIFPWGAEAEMLAFALVALTAATGILAHLANGKVQKAALVLAVLLIVTQGLLAFQRTREFLASGGMVDLVERDGGGLLLDGDGQVNEFQAPPEETAITHTSRSSLNPTVLLATATAVLFSSAAVVTFWGGTNLGGSTLALFAGGIGLAIWAVFTAPLFFLHLIVLQDRLTKVILAMADSIFAICKLPLKAIEGLRPASFRRRKWEQNQEKATSNDKVAHARTGALHEKAIADRQRAHELMRQDLLHKYALSQLETLVELSHLHKDACLSIHRKTISLMHQVSESAVSMIEDEYREELQARVQPQIANVTEVLFDYTLGPIQMTKDVSQLQDLLTTVHGSGNHNPERTKGVKDENAFHKESSSDASTAAD